MCNLYSITTSQAAIASLFRVVNRYEGNLPPMFGVFPDYPAPIVRDAAGVTPHFLRHTAATWLMQRGADPWQAAGYLGMSLNVLLSNYGHHYPDYLSDAVNKISERETKAERTQHVSGAKLVR